MIGQKKSSPACFLFAIFRPFPTRVFGLPITLLLCGNRQSGLDKNSVRCFMKNISKKQVEIGDLTLKIIIFYFFLFFVQFYFFFFFFDFFEYASAYR